MIVDDFKGYVYFKEENYPFLFQKDTITIIPYSIEKCNELSIEWFHNDSTKSNKNKWAEKIILEGVTDKYKGVKFLVTDIPNINNGYYSFKVEYMYIYEYKDKMHNMKDIKGIKFSGPECNYIYDISKYKYINTDLKFKGDKFDEYSMVLSSQDDKNLGKFRWNGYSISINGSLSWRKVNDAYSPLEISSIIKLEFSSFCNDLYKIIDLAILQRRVLYFMTYRKNIIFNKIEMYNYTENNLIRSIGQLYLFDEDIVPESDIKDLRQLINIDDINDDFAKIYKMVNKNHIYTLHIPDTFRNRKEYNPSRILGILIAFEHTYDAFYKNKMIVNEDYEEIRKMVIDYLNSLKGQYSGSKKVQIRKMINSVGKLRLDYGEYLKNALYEHYNVLKPIIIKQYQVKNARKVIVGCSKRLNDIRNSMSHGELDIQYKPINSRDIHIVEYLIYCIILKEIGLSDDIISNKINELFNLRI